MHKNIWAAAALAVFGMSPAFATPVTWTLQDVSFSNGSAVTGSFVFDRDTGSFSDISISVSAGTGYGPEVYTAMAPSSGNYYGVTFAALPISYTDNAYCAPDGAGASDPTCGTHAFGLFVYPAEMTNAGGVISLSSAWLGHCNDAICNSGSWQYLEDYTSTAGSITAVPVPAAAWAFTSALGLLGLRRKKATV